VKDGGWGNYESEAFICLVSGGLPGGAMENDKKKSVSMPRNADRGFNRGHCQFAAKKVSAML